MLFAARIIDSLRIDTDSLFKAGAVIRSECFRFCHNIPPFDSCGLPEEKPQLMIHRRSFVGVSALTFNISL